MRSEALSMTTEFDPAGPRIQPAECEKHGNYDQKVTTLLGREFKSGCPECQRIISEQREASEQLQKAYEARTVLVRKLGAALIPKRFADKTLSQYRAESKEQMRALAICKRYVEVFSEIQETGRCLMLLGKPGTGKTHLGAAIANDLMHNTAASAVYRTVGAVLQSIRATYDRSSERTAAEILASLIEPDLLVLDEVGVSKEQPSDFELTTLFAIINGRYEQVRPTVVISNLDAAQLPQAMGERCVDRLREGGGVVVVFDWESQRGKEGV